MEAKIDLIYPESGKVFGNVAQRLFANNMDPNALRSNAGLPLETWKEIDSAVLKVARNRMPIVGDLISRGLTYPLKNALGKTVLAYQKLTDMADAHLDMDALTESIKDRPSFTWGYLPIPICHADFDISARDLAASKNGDQPLDTTMIELATRKVAEKIESITILGSSTFTFGGGVIYGLHDFTPAATGSLAPHWDHTAATGATILVDVQKMIAAVNAKKHWGPFVLYTPTAFDPLLDNPFNAYTGTTIREQIKKIASITDVKPADYLPADHVALVELDQSTIRIIEGMQPTPIEWDSKGGMNFHFKVMAILVPQLRADSDSNTGIAVYS
jgi:uncharacterized linocin/CFP29 family protein